MLGTYLTGVVATVAIAGLWVGIQNAWRTTCADDRPLADVLSGRIGCHGCSCDDGDSPCDQEPREEQG